MTNEDAIKHLRIVGELEDITPNRAVAILHAIASINDMVKLTAENEKAKELLKELEWSGDKWHFLCPGCLEEKNKGHKPECKLSQFISKE